MDKDSRPIHSQQAFGRFHAAGRVNLIVCRGHSSKRMQPSRSSIHAPARFVRDHLGRTMNGQPQGFTSPLQTSRRPQDAATTGAPSDRDFKQHRQKAFDFAVTQSEFFIANGYRGVDVRAQLHTFGSRGVGGLKFVSPLNGGSASTAQACINLKSSMNHCARNIDLILCPCPGFGQLVTTTIRAALRQRDAVRFVNLLWNAAAMVLAMVLGHFCVQAVSDQVCASSETVRLDASLPARLFQDVAQAA